MTAGVSVSLWPQGEKPSLLVEEKDWGAGLVWFEIGPEVSNQEAIFSLLGSRCQGLTKEILEEVFEPDPDPDEDSFGEIRVVSTFQVRIDPEENPRYMPGEPSKPGTLVFDPVEICAGKDWVISKRHPSFRIEGEREVPDNSTPNLDEATRALVDIWVEYGGESAADLATMLMIELSMSYEEAYRHLRHWTEDWELELYREPEHADEEELIHIWHCMIRLRGWLRILFIKDLIHGDSVHAFRAWFPKARPAEIIEVNEHISNALNGLVNLADILRSAFQSYYSEQDRQEVKKREVLQRKIEIGAVVFLVPTLLAGIAGANTWIPGQADVSGFVFLMVLMILSTLITLWLLGLLGRKK